MVRSYPERVLVTGATGFLATHCILRLLGRGLHVRGTIRDSARVADIRNFFDQRSGGTNRFQVVVADLTTDHGWNDAVNGCDCILHVASPFPTRLPRNDEHLIVPARDGTLRVLRAAAKAGLSRVVVTSSISAIVAGHDTKGQRFDEGSWSKINGNSRIGAYAKSKTLAERAAWEFIAGPENVGGLELAAINPGVILGPVLCDTVPTSGELIRRLMTRTVPWLTPFWVSCVDVRDVANAHIAALVTPEAAGKRFCCVGTSCRKVDIAAILNRHFQGRGLRIPTREIPLRLIKCLAAFSPTTRAKLQSVGTCCKFSSELIENVLSWRARPLKESVIDMAESMIERRLV